MPAMAIAMEQCRSAGSGGCSLTLPYLAWPWGDGRSMMAAVAGQAWIFR
uniref:Uncharacterized protein n=1 Tax=Arundo donax TaxID=35708 RepID=A0A0A9CDF2_ARUDO